MEKQLTTVGIVKKYTEFGMPVFETPTEAYLYTQEEHAAVQEALLSEWAKGIKEGLASQNAAPKFDLINHLNRQIEWSSKTFGKSNRWKGIIEHIREELKEIESDPSDLIEWVDVLILVLDGMWRMGKNPIEICQAIDFKMTKNENRKWPELSTQDPDKAINHDRTTDVAQ